MADWSAYTYEGQEYSEEFRLQKPDDTIIWVRVRSTPMLSDQNELLGHVGSIEDITERKLLESARNQVMVEQAGRREAETANRMKDEFLAVLSHELRTPLNSILGWSKLLRTRKFDEEKTARALETIERNANTQSQLIEDILDVSQIIRGKLRLNFTPLNLVSVIQAAIDSVRPQAEAKEIELASFFDNSQGKISGDAVRIQQVVWNLLTNAIKFTPEKGKVEVRLTVSNEQEGNFDDSVISAQPAYAEIQVIDTGIGINPDFLPKVFDRFLQADSTRTRSHNGLGLGLAIVRHMVELHGGKVYAASEGENKGAIFTVQLPIRQPGKYTALPKVNTSAVQDNETPTLDGINILVVDDEADTREFLAFALEQCGANTMVANSVSKALLTLPDFHPDVLISDIGMPDQDGYTLIRQIRELELLRGGSIPAIALTAYSQEKDRKQAIAAGFQMHLSKPVDIEELISAIAQLLNQKSLSSNAAIKEASISI